MTLWSNPEVRLYWNPWQQSVPDGVFLQQLQTAAHEVCVWGQNSDSASDIDTSKSYATVLLDPTNRFCTNPLQRVMAAVLFGSDAVKYLPNAAAKADFRDRNGDPVHYLEVANFAFGDDDFAYGGSAVYEGAVAAGSGLSEKQDGDVALKVMATFLPKIHRMREHWLTETRKDGRKQAWFNRANEVPDLYKPILERMFQTPVRAA
jgi:hypothetical protein